uniref:LRRNT domain-containing protein n=1 Tax=Biomphalaria glabrata TaxID=6526 RepID=A0A2C9L9R2_BIOGL
MSECKMLQVSLLCLLSLMLLSRVTAICPVSQPCQCDISIHCQNRNLTEVPPAMSSDGEDFLGLYLSQNRITDIRSDTLQGYHVSSIDLSHNPLVHLDNMAFVGMEKYLLELNLEDVHITTLPSSIGQLINLQTLNIKNNPISGIPSAFTANIGQSLLRWVLGSTDRTKCIGSGQ